MCNSRASQSFNTCCHKARVQFSQCLSAFWCACLNQHLLSAPVSWASNWRKAQWIQLKMCHTYNMQKRRDATREETASIEVKCWTVKLLVITGCKLVLHQISSCNLEVGVVELEFFCYKDSQK